MMATAALVLRQGSCKVVEEGGQVHVFGQRVFAKMPC
jgi:hypothetical protein